MENFLVFRLYAPLASWGDIAVGEVRRSASYPSRSAILGLVSAALGIYRDEEENLAELFAGIEVAVKVLSAGTLLKDYQTTQAPDNAGKAKYFTRYDEIVLGKQRLSTILSSREYRCDSLYIVALRGRNESVYSLEAIKDKLLFPAFVLYLGRKSCPLGAPLSPQIISSPGFKNALDSAKFPALITSPYSQEDITEKLLATDMVRYYWEGDAGDMEPQQTIERRDDPMSRIRWQFSPRKEHIMTEKRRR